MCSDRECWWDEAWDQTQGSLCTTVLRFLFADFEVFSVHFQNNGTDEAWDRAQGNL